MDPTPPMPEAPSAPPPPPAPTSLAARVLNVFASPGEVFEEVKAAPTTVANWLVPCLVFAVVGVVACLIIFSQPTIIQQLRNEQTKKIEQQVKSGAMTQADANKVLEVMDKFVGPTTMKIAGSVSAVVMGFMRLFWWGFILWLAALWFLKVRISYMKALEVTGLATMITVLGVIVGLLLVVNFGKLFSSPSLALAVSDFDAQKKSHLLLGAANVFSFWFIGVLSAGLSRLAGVRFTRALFVILTYWVLQELVLIFAGLGQMAQ
jgi:hypothetical protein